MTKKVVQLQGHLRITQMEISDLQKNSAYSALPDAQKIVVQNCLSNAKRHKNGLR